MSKENNYLENLESINKIAEKTNALNRMANMTSLSNIASKVMEMNNYTLKPNDDMEISKIDLKEVMRNYNYADFKYEKIKEQITKFQLDLSDDYDVMVQMAMFGKEIIMSVEDISYQNPDLLYFYGTINGQKAQLIQHQSQLNFLLLACKKQNPNDKPKRIGFITDDIEEN